MKKLVGMLFVTLLWSGFAHAQLLWEYAVSVPAISKGPDMWKTCARGEQFSQGEEPACIRMGAFLPTQGGAVKVVTTQGLLAMHYTPPLGYKAVAVGVLPAIGEGKNFNDYSKDSVLVAYRLERL